MAFLRGDVARVPEIARQHRLSGRLAAAEEMLRIALQVEYDPRLSVELALNLLAQGRFNDGWPLYEDRLLVNPGLRLPYPIWRGQILTGRNLVVLAEGAPAIQRLFLPPVADLLMRTADVTFLCHPSLVASGHEMGLLAIPAVGETKFPEPDFWIPQGSVPGVIGWGSSEIRAWAQTA